MIIYYNIMDKKSIFSSSKNKYDDLQFSERTEAEITETDNTAERISGAFFKTESPQKYKKALMESNESIDVDDKQNYFSKVNLSNFKTMKHEKRDLFNLELVKTTDIEQTGLIEDVQPEVTRKEVYQVIRSSLKKQQVDLSKFKIKIDPDLMRQF